MRRRKILQIINLIENDVTIPENLNESIPTEDFFQVLQGFQNFWKVKDGSDTNSQEASWNEIYAGHFQEILTRWGLCYSFNLINKTKLFHEVSDDLTFIHEYFITLRTASELPVYEMDEENPLKTRSPELGFHATLTDYDESLDFWADWAPEEAGRYKNPFHVLDGYRVMFHSSLELPNMNSVHHYTTARQALMFWIVPHMTKIDVSLKDLQPEERNCYLEQERSLKFFQIYTQNNCEQECLANYTLKLCGCVQFFMMREST